MPFTVDDKVVTLTMYDDLTEAVTITNDEHTRNILGSRWYEQCELTNYFRKWNSYIPIFLSRVCSSKETFSVRLNLLLGKLASPSTSVSPFVNDPPVPILNLSSKSPKSITLWSRSSSSSLNIVPRTWKQNNSHITKTFISIYKWLSGDFLKMITILYHFMVTFRTVLYYILPTCLNAVRKS